MASDEFRTKRSFLVIQRSTKNVGRIRIVNFQFVPLGGENSTESNFGLSGSIEPNFGLNDFTERKIALNGLTSPNLDWLTLI